jgi:hypothetical protein
MGFPLAPGAEERAPWFAAITLHRYAAALVGPDAEPLGASIWSIGILSEDKCVRGPSPVDAVLARQGPIPIRTAVGRLKASPSPPSAEGAAWTWGVVGPPSSRRWPAICGQRLRRKAAGHQAWRVAVLTTSCTTGLRHRLAFGRALCAKSTRLGRRVPLWGHCL